MTDAMIDTIIKALGTAQTILTAAIVVLAWGIRKAFDAGSHSADVASKITLAETRLQEVQAWHSSHREDHDRLEGRLHTVELKLEHVLARGSYDSR